MIKVKELIEILKKHDPEKIVVVDYMDHTDWWYVCELDKEDISLNEVYIDPESPVREELGFDVESEDEDVEVLMITLNENKSITSF
jgi:hypothetical protein